MISQTSHLGVAPVPIMRVIALITVFTMTGIATVATIFVADGNLIAAVAPAVAVAAIAALTVISPRRPLLLVMLLCLSSDKPGDASGLWTSPLAPIGGLLTDNLNKTIHIPAAKISLLLLLLLFLLAVRFCRGIAGHPLRDAGMPGTARPLIWGITASIAAVAAVSAYGIMLGGDAQMAKVQLQTFLATLAMGYLLATSLHGIQDFRNVAKILVIAACVKSMMAVWIRLTVPGFINGKEIEYATSHGDSMLFAGALVVLISRFFEAPTRRNLLWILLVGSVVFAGMIANNRRLVWVQLIVPVVMMIAMNLRSRPARAILRITIFSLPLILAYGLIGWNSSSRVFAPVHTIRTMTDAQVDRSTFFRDIENYNLLYTFGRHPLLGTGFGHPFEEAVRNDMLVTFKEYPYMPHNSILGLWAFGGAIGFYGLCVAYIIGVFLAARSFFATRSPEHRAAALSAIGLVAIYLIHCWGDIGFSEQKSIFLVGTALAFAGQLASTTGAWREPFLAVSKIDQQGERRVANQRVQVADA